ncbi:MAG: pseudaminic acid synthase [Lentisphaeraceae bacterium]|nr:pseudaminic acid synthase [Lentisphaeraceae bacterium]
MNNPIIEINGRKIGKGYPCYIIAELSANHNQSFEKAVEIIKAAKAAGADAVKLQTYTADTLTLDCDNEHFQIGKGTVWEGRTLHDLYKEAYTPWEWQPKLQKIAEELGLDFFSSPFDSTSVDFLEQMKVPCYKIASFEIVDLPLIRKVASLGKPVIMSTGMASLTEIDEAVKAIRDEGNEQIILLKCTSAYPALPEEMNLNTLPHLAASFGVSAGLSDHTLGVAVPVAAVALGATVIEKHMTLSRADGGPDSSFSLEPEEFKVMVDNVRFAEQSLGVIDYNLTDKEQASKKFRRSLFAIKDIKSGEDFSEDNVRSIRPGAGLEPKYLELICTKKARIDILRGTPISWDCF